MKKLDEGRAKEREGGRLDKGTKTDNDNERKEKVSF